MGETYYILQTVFIAILVAITAYYAVQTHRQVDLIKRQLDETIHIHSMTTRRQSTEEIYKWAQYGVDEYCFPGLGRHGRDNYPVSPTNTVQLLSLGTRAISNAAYLGGDLQDKVEAAWDSVGVLLASLKVDIELAQLSDSEYEQHTKDVQKSLKALSNKLQDVMKLCDELRIELHKETSK